MARVRVPREAPIYKGEQSEQPTKNGAKDNNQENPSREHSIDKLEELNSIDERRKGHQKKNLLLSSAWIQTHALSLMRVFDLILPPFLL